MIAVFCLTQAQFDRELRVSPKNNFVRIRDEINFLGRKFDSVVVMNGFFEKSTNKQFKDFEALRKRQPEIFKDIL